jgi:DNA-binding CsgD family transcriptional regulator
VKLDVARLLDAIYRTGNEDEEWLSEVVRAASPHGEPVFAYTFRTDPTRGVRFGPMVDRGKVHPAWREHVQTSVQSAPPAQIDAHFRGRGRFDLELRSATPATRHWIDRILRSTSVDDVLMTIVTAPSGAGITLGFPLSSVRPLAARTRHVLNRVAAHLTTACRLREALSATVAPGTLENRPLYPNAPPSREPIPATSLALRAAELLHSGQLRTGDTTSQTLSRERALTVWGELTQGLWSPIDHVDLAGRRLILVRRNPSRGRDNRALTEEERLVAASAALGRPNKLIAYELGVSEASVSEALKRALQKLGFGSRAELVAVLNSFR